VEEGDERQGRGARGWGGVATMPNDPRPRDHTDAAKDIEPQTSPENIASQIATFNGEANAYLGDPNYNHAKAAQVRERPRRCRGCGGGGQEAGAPQRGRCQAKLGTLSYLGTQRLGRQGIGAQRCDRGGAW
jgi:hypothetical protein